MSRPFLQRLIKIAPTIRGVAARFKKAGASAIELRLVGPTEMKRLNRRYRGKNKVTDILSFGVPSEMARATGTLGELVICTSMLKKQAREHGHSERAEMQVLLVHGFLHLLGFDHELGAAQARKMARLEAKLLGATKVRGTKGLITRVAKR